MALRRLSEAAAMKGRGMRDSSREAEKASAASWGWAPLGRTEPKSSEEIGLGVTVGVEIGTCSVVEVEVGVRRDRLAVHLSVDWRIRRRSCKIRRNAFGTERDRAER